MSRPLKTLIVCNPLEGDALHTLRNIDGLRVKVEPFISTEKLPYKRWSHQVPSDTRSWIFTSKNAVAAVEPVHELLPEPERIYCVGPKTRDSLWNTEVRTLTPDEFNKYALTHLLLKSPSARFIHFKGSLSDDTLKQAMIGTDKELTDIIVYETKTLVHTVDMTDCDALLFMSPSSVEGFCRSNPVPEDRVICCIGPTTAEMARRSGFRHILMPQEATIESAAQTLNMIL